MEKLGLRFEGGFVYPPEILPFWAEELRRGVRHVINADGFAPATSSDVI